MTTGRNGALRTFVSAHPLWFVFIVALLVRVALALTAYSVFGQSPVLDDETYSNMAADAASGMSSNWDEHTRFLYNRTATLMLPLTALYSLFGPHQIVGQLFVALAGAVTAVLATKLALEAFSPVTSLATGLVAALLPSQVLWSALVLKDPFVWLMLVSLALTVAIAGRVAGWRLVACGAAVIVVLVLLAYLRLHTFVVACIALALSAWVGNTAYRWQRAVAGIAIAIAVPWLLGVGPLGIGFIRDGAASLDQLRVLNAVGADSAFVDPVAPPSEELTEEEVRELEDPGTVSGISEELHTEEQLVQRVIAALGGGLRDAEVAALAEEFEVTEARVRQIAAAARQRARGGPIEPAPPPAQDEGLLEPSVAHLPRGLAVMLFEPVPGRATDSRAHRLAQAEMLLWYPLLILGAIGLPWLARRHRVAAFPLLAGGGVLLMYALSEGNIGTAYRHRGEFVWVVALATAAAVARWRERRDTDDQSEKQTAAA